ncbi:hypothetical protein BT96DRAFT_1003708 [Gymnopus androsaceus JB14]|uniref:Uncharacterized protein n=1 Tax=Gymnopus androsaceus JB14 TaxID=1447944 RepID=A0A6A4GUX9_9AGAR|nr:hypothetical protein BT96DRAFT_1003708 [Gymnopus androsaceus JB14]
MILGVCQEHGGSCLLEFHSIVEPKTLLQCLHNESVHLASEATVMAITLLTGEPKDYSACPFSIQAVQQSQSQFFRTLYYIASNGAANQCCTASSLTLTHKLSPEDNIYAPLSLLRLLNLLCGQGGLLRLSIYNVAITDSILKLHLMHLKFMTEEIAASLLAPNDRQDVTLMVRLLKALASLPGLPNSASPTMKATQCILTLLGELYRHLLNAYLNNIQSGRGESCRLKVKSISEAVDGEISSKYDHDHINPITWHGDVLVQNVVLVSCWDEGQKIAEVQLWKAGVEPPFDRMEHEGGYDILCPLGDNKILLVSDLGVREANEAEDEAYNFNGPTEPVSSLLTSKFSSEAPSLRSFTDTELEPEIEDVAGEQESTESNGLRPTAWVADPVDGADTKMIHKSTILCIYSSPLHSPDSTNRTWRVCGYSKYSDPALPDGFDMSQVEDSNIISVEDPAVTLLKCEGHAFLAVVKLGTIKCNSCSTLSLPVNVLHEPNVEVDGQIMSLKMINGHHHPLQPDWELRGQLESTTKGMLKNIPGHMIEPVNPELGRSSHDPTAGETYVFHTNELRGIAAILAECLQQDIADGKLTEFPRTVSFPYRTTTTCPLCPTNAPAVWKYNLEKHISVSHHGAMVNLYKNLFDVDTVEHTLMKKVFDTKPWAKKSKVKSNELAISEGYSTGMVLRYAGIESNNATRLVIGQEYGGEDDHDMQDAHEGSSDIWNTNLGEDNNLYGGDPMTVSENKDEPIIQKQVSDNPIPDDFQEAEPLKMDANLELSPTDTNPH